VIGAQAGELGHGRKRDLVGDVLFDTARDGALLPAGEPTPRAHKGAPFGLWGLTAQRGQAGEATVPKNAKKRPLYRIAQCGVLFGPTINRFAG
jgi:hypothetical protein